MLYLHKSHTHHLVADIELYAIRSCFVCECDVSALADAQFPEWIYPVIGLCPQQKRSFPCTCFMQLVNVRELVFASPSVTTNATITPVAWEGLEILESLDLHIATT